jgi:hypothetical protein
MAAAAADDGCTTALTTTEDPTPSGGGSQIIAVSSKHVSLSTSLMSPHVITFLGLGQPQWGRLGNQLFQIGYCWALAKITYRNCIFPSDSFKYSEYFETKIRALPGLALQNQLTNVQTYQESSSTYHPFPLTELDADRPWNVQGFFQSWKYLACFRDELREYLRLRTDIETELRRHWDLEGSACERAFRNLGIHVRRGDFVSSGTLEVLAQPYYRLALETYLQQASEKRGLNGHNGRTMSIRVTVASDDLVWCKEALGPLVQEILGDRLVLVQYAENQLDILDLFTLSYCDDLIVSNSSFSWMSAFLMSSPDTAVVISPKVHFTNGRLDTVMPTWVQIDTPRLK